MAIWEFKQLSGEKKTLRLEDYAQPFGRPRKEPLFKEIVKVTIQTQTRPGSKLPPVRLGFGSHFEPLELHGRWMSKYLQNSVDGRSANAFADDWTSFVRDESPIRMSWGNILSYEGFIEQLELARESQHEIAWKMTILVDRRADLPVTVQQRDPPTVITDIDRFSTAIHAMEPPDIDGGAIDLFDTLVSISSSLKSLTGIVVDIANAFDNLEKQTYSTIQSFRGVLANLNTGIVTMRNTVLATQVDAAIVVRQAKADFDWDNYRLTFDVESLVALKILRDLDRQLEIHGRSDVSKAITAIDKDTWEILAVRAGSGVDRAGAIREANGILYGQDPTPGETYLIPV